MKKIMVKEIAKEMDLSITLNANKDLTMLDAVYADLILLIAQNITLKMELTCPVLKRSR